ncbi:Bug family tripartite tricarboxylate transporter substrate binding protein [Sporosarcina cyprini]|uniref:Bug family tripartite tricarboxylate transporter substrate binding protein n=1 Tax=Sporosarcina cyprini TaxID=2910523 RepID=UPI001EDFD4E2|nr:tripartite tricarboxylate transporter substrate binding protein [Sporosarcina cyprini]MCG3088264.1 tripartite tricarboxylate transporter substrate binding protein [Sporosarcina cyprini]
MKLFKSLKVLTLGVLVMGMAACSNTGGKVESADNYPSRAISLTIPYAAGGSADLQARIVSEVVQKDLGETVNIISKPGGAGSTGMTAVKSAKPDGYNIILTAVGPSTLTPNANNVGYDVTTDFKQIAQISEAPYGIAVNSDSGIKTLEELMNFAHEKKVTYGTTGAGLHQHVVTAAFVKSQGDLDMEHIPFEGGAEAVTALLGNHINASVNTISELLPHDGNGLTILAVTSKERLEELPDVPTFEELGYDLIGNGAWFGMMAPKDTPDDIISKLDESIRKALEDPGVIEQFKKAGIPIAYLNAEDFTKKVKDENEKNKEVVTSLND